MLGECWVAPARTGVLEGLASARPRPRWRLERAPGEARIDTSAQTTMTSGGATKK